MSTVIATRKPLELRGRLSERRPIAVRRHALRVVSRVGILVAADCVAFFVVRAALRTWMPRVTLEQDAIVRDVGPLASPGEPASLIFGIWLLLGLALSGSYSRHRGLNTAVRLAVAAIVAAAAVMLPLSALIGVGRAAAHSLAIGVAIWVGLLLARTAAERFLRDVWPRGRGAKSAVLVGDRESIRSSVATAIEAPGGDYRITHHHQVASAATRDPEVLATEVRALVESLNAEAVVLCDALPHRQVHALFEIAVETGCELLYPARAIRTEGVRPRLVWHHDQPFFELGTRVLRVPAVITKRITDIVGATVIGLVAAPLIVVVALAIKLDSPGPVLFAQDRAGLGGRRFRMLKFRTMRFGADGEKQDVAHLNRSGDRRLFKIPADPRVTALGRLLRRWSLDELPQLWNVLTGEMSLVGPRPFFEEDFVAYEDHHFRRLDAKPGVTGLWQVSGRSNVVQFEDVVFLDRQYMENWSFWLDISILFRTVPAVMRRTGAY